MCSPSCFSQHQAGFMFGECPRKSIILNAWFQLWNMEMICDDLGSNTLALCWSQNCSEWSYYCQGLRGASYGPIFFPNNDTIFQDNTSPIHTAVSVQSWFEEHEDALQHLPWPAQSPDLNIIGQFCRVGWEADSLLHHLSSNSKLFFMRSGTLFHSRIFRTLFPLFCPSPVPLS